MSSRKTYKIEYWMELPPVNSRWVLFSTFQYMQKSFAEGAFAMLKSFYGGGKKYRLVDSDGKVVDEWNTGYITTT